MFSPLWMEKIRGARANRTRGASIDGYNSQSPREQWRYRCRLLSFFRASAGVAFQPCLCDSQELNLQSLIACSLYNLVYRKIMRFQAMNRIIFRFVGI